MKILFVSYFAPPIASAESIQVAKTLRGLARAGCEITVVAASGSRLYREDDELVGILPPSVRVTRTPARENLFRHRLTHLVAPFLIYKPDAMRKWAESTASTVRSLASTERFDLLVTRAQPFSSHLVGLEVARELRLPWLAHFSDPLADNPFYYRFWANPHRAYNAGLEARIVTEADEVHVVSNEMADVFRRRHGNAARIAVIPHCYESDLYGGATPPPLATAGPIRILHSGTFTGRRNPVNFFRAVQAVAQRNPALGDRIKLRFCGSVARRYLDLAAGLGLGEKLEVTGQVGYLSSLRHMTEADWLLLIDADFDGGSMFFPSKLVDYIGAGRPVLALTPRNGASARILREAGSDRTANPDDIGAIADYLENMLTSGAAAPAAPQLSSETVTSSLLGRCEALVKTAKGAVTAKGVHSS